MNIRNAVTIQEKHSITPVQRQSSSSSKTFRPQQYSSTFCDHEQFYRIFFVLAKYLQNIVSKVNQNFIPFRNLGYLCFYPFLKFYKTRQEAKNITL